MFPGPVFDVELLTLARRKRYYALRFIYGLLLLYFIWQNTWSWTSFTNRPGTVTLSYRELSQIGQQIFTTFAFTQAIVILLIAPAQVAGVVADERQRKTLHYLLASRLTSPEIVVGKLAARLLSLYIYLALGLPILVIVSFFGGIDPLAILLYFTACATTTFFLAAASVAVSVQAKRPKDAVTTMYLVEVAWLFGPSMLERLLPNAGGFWIQLYEWIKPLNEWIGVSSPFHWMFHNLIRGFNPTATMQAILWLMGTQILYGMLLVAFAVARLRPIHRNEGATGGQLSQTLSRQASRLFPRPPCGDDAIFWKERYVSRTSPIAKIAGALVLLGAIGSLGYATYQYAEPALEAMTNVGFSAARFAPQQTELNGYLRLIETVIAACWMIGIASSASSGLTSEREGDTWISLIATPLTPTEIVRAKMFGAFWAVRWIGLIWLGLLLTGVVLLAVQPLGFLALVLCNSVYLWFACALGTFFSLRATNSARALMATIAVLIFCNALYLIFLSPFQMNNPPFHWLGVTPLINAVALMGYHDVPNREPGFALIYLASVAVYALAAFILTCYLVLNFDDALDRPRTQSEESPVRLDKFTLPAEDG